jgi:hypothetical protein
VIKSSELYRRTSDGASRSGETDELVKDSDVGTPALVRAASYTTRLVVFVAVNIELGVGSESTCILSGGPYKE